MTARLHVLAFNGGSRARRGNMEKILQPFLEGAAAARALTTGGTPWRPVVVDEPHPGAETGGTGFLRKIGNFRGRYSRRCVLS